MGSGPARMISIMESLGRRRRTHVASFALAFKAEIVELCRRDRQGFDIAETAVRDWV